VGALCCSFGRLNVGLLQSNTDLSSHLREWASWTIVGGAWIAFVFLERDGCWAGETEGRMEGVVSARGKGMW